MMTTRSLLPLLVLLLLTAKAGAQPPSTNDKTADEIKQRSDRRLVEMTEMAGRYAYTGGPGNGTAFVLHKKPLLHWTNPVSDVQDGTLWVWTVDGRPQVTSTIFNVLQGTLWIHHLQSLSDRPFELRYENDVWWTPAKSGLQMKPVPDAPPPASGKPARLVQMRRIARDFKVIDDFKVDFGSDEIQTQELRLLAQPVYRYGRADGPLRDGAMFVFAVATDPEAFLLLEARETNTGLAWHYGLAGMTIYALRGHYKGRKVWEQPNWQKEIVPTNPYYVTQTK